MGEQGQGQERGEIHGGAARQERTAEGEGETDVGAKRVPQRGAFSAGKMGSGGRGAGSGRKTRLDSFLPEGPPRRNTGKTWPGF